MQIHISGHHHSAGFAMRVLGMLRAALSLAYIWPTESKATFAMDVFRGMSGLTVQEFRPLDADGRSVNLLLLITDCIGESLTVLITHNSSVEDLELCADSFVLHGWLESEHVVFQCQSANFSMADAVDIAAAIGKDVSIAWDLLTHTVSIASYDMPAPSLSVITAAALPDYSPGQLAVVAIIL